MGMSHSGGPQINVTPLIDVLLVLLVIVLVIIPVMQEVETVQLPPSDPSSEPMRVPVIVKLHADATASIDEGSPMMAVDLWSRLKPRIGTGATVFVDFEDGVPWGDVIGAVDGVRGLVGDPDSIHVAVRIRGE